MLSSVALGLTLRLACPSGKASNWGAAQIVNQHPSIHEQHHTIMGASKKARKFGAVKRIIGQRDARLLRQNNRDIDEKKKAAETIVRQVPQVSSSLFFQYNTALVPPYSVLVDTNFLSHTVQRKLPLLESMMDTLYAKCVPIITSCGQHSPLPFSPSSLHTNADTLMV